MVMMEDMVMFSSIRRRSKVARFRCPCHAMSSKGMGALLGDILRNNMRFLSIYICVRINALYF